MRLSAQGRPARGPAMTDPTTRALIAYNLAIAALAMMVEIFDEV